MCPTVVCWKHIDLSQSSASSRRSRRWNTRRVREPSTGNAGTAVFDGKSQRHRCSSEAKPVAGDEGANEEFHEDGRLFQPVQRVQVKMIGESILPDTRQTPAELVLDLSTPEG